MTRCLIGLIGALALLVVGCGETAGVGGAGGEAGAGGHGGAGLCAEVSCNAECKTDGVCNPADGTCDYGGVAEDGATCSEGKCLDGICARPGAFPCTEQGIRDAIAEGGGPHFFACDGPTTIVPETQMTIDNGVILDGEGNLTIDVVNTSRLGLERAELRNFAVIGAVYSATGATLFQSTATCANPWHSCLAAEGEFTLIDSTVACDVNSARSCGAMLALGDVTLVNTTLVGSPAITIGSTFGCGFDIGDYPCKQGFLCEHLGHVTVTASTIVGDVEGTCMQDPAGAIASSLVDGACSWPSDRGGSSTVPWASLGHNIESPGDTCGFDQPTDQVNVTAEQLALEPLQDNGGPTETHALGAGSIAIDQIPAEDCVDADGAPLTTDQRAVARPQGSSCDVGAFELEQ